MTEDKTNESSPTDPALTPEPYEMGVGFVEREDLPDSIPLMQKPVSGWAVYSRCEDHCPTFEGFHITHRFAEEKIEERNDEGDRVLFDAGVFVAILLPEGLVTSNDYALQNHGQLAERIEQWRARGWGVIA